jgi:signal transduction histidine kinase/ActR/RegA family two-component response regulator
MSIHKAGPQFYKFWQFCLVAACLCFSLLGGQTAVAAPTPVKVGYFYDMDYMHLENSIYKGYNVDYLYAVANYTNWQYQFVTFKGFGEAYAALQQGEIDLLPSLFYSPERAGQVLFSADNMGRVYVTLVVGENDNSHGFNDFVSFKNMRVGVLSHSLDAQAFRDWSASHDLQCRITGYDSEDAMFAALENGSVDGLGITYLGASSKYRIVAEFSPMPLYFALNRNRPDLKKTLDQALESLYFDNPGFQSNLHDKYFSLNKDQLPVFAKAEQEFLARKQPIRVALQVDNAPFCFEDEKGQPIGVIPDLYRKLAFISGLNFTYVTAPTMMEAIQLVHEGKADVVGKLTLDSGLAMKHALRMTRPYMEMGLTQVTLKTGGAIRTVGIPTPLRPLFGDTVIGSQGKPAQVLLMPNSNKAFAALQDGKIDAAYMNSASTNYLLNTGRAAEYNFTSLPAHNYGLVAGISSNADPLLFSILNKSLRYVNHNDLDELAVKYSLNRESGFRHFLNSLSPATLFTVSLILAAVVIGLILLIVKVVRQGQAERALAAEKIRLEAVEKNAEEKNQFFANISHDLRTPLNAIIGFSGLAQNSDDQSLVRTYLHKINSSGQLMLDLVNDTLTMSKLRSGKLELKPEPVTSDPQIFFAAVFDVARELAAAKKIDLSVTSEAELRSIVMVDRLNLQKILLNLLTNAVKYTPEGGHINVHFWNEPAADGALESLVSIQDDGIGITPEFQDKVFEPFWQERRPGYESTGTGLGLAIVKQLVTLMGGTITLTSVPDQGSTFTLRFKFPPAPAGTKLAAENMAAGTTAAETGTAAGTTAATETNSLQKLRGRVVLLCEDNQLNREIACALLQSKGMTVVTANDGRQGVEIFSASEPGTLAAVLMDLRMPVLDGYEATKEMRALSRPDAKTIPIIALSAETFAEDVQKCLAAGMNDHVAKPLVPGVLFATLAKYVGP